MQCEKCHAEYKDTDVVCPECGAPVAHAVEGFPNAVTVQQTVRSIYNEFGEDAVKDIHRFIGLLKDHLPEYDRERRLLINALLAGAFKFMLDEQDKEIAVKRAKSCILTECCVTDEAADYVLVCFAYMLGIVYEPVAVETSAKAAAPKEEKEKEEVKPLRIDSVVFKSTEATRFRLSGNVNIPDGVTKIDSYCFNGFGFMKNLTLPDTVMAIGEYAFSECKRLKGVVLPARLKKIERGAFSQCGKLAVIKIPKGVLEIEDDTFSMCENLEVVEIPDTVSSIGTYAFSGCEKLRMLFLPQSVKYIDDKAFELCPELVIRCYENSYVHKYCMKNEITVETVEYGADLTAKLTEEG
ncbi:MAG: leucine-rich repeat protein [Ruminococcus sp.]|nr:leucine-rich repeat protein [Ruminococcus sp.]